MSRGPGSQQRLILDTLDQCGPFYLVALADGDMGARYKSLYRAAVRLFDADKIGIVQFRRGTRKVAITLPGDDKCGPTHTPIGTINAPITIDRGQIEENTKQVEAAR